MTYLPAVKRRIEESIPGFAVQDIAFEGEGDFCRAYTVNGEWIFRFAHNPEGSRSLEREAALLPGLAPTLSLPVPNISYFGHVEESGLAFVGYPRIEGVELTREHLNALEPARREKCAQEVAGFLTALHSFPLGLAQELGVPRCDYPFCRTEEGILPGSAREIYSKEGERLASNDALDEETGIYCGRLVERLTSPVEEEDLPHSLVHGDLSQEHILFDPRIERITGVIDFTDTIVTSPLLDFVYLSRAYGRDFLELLLRHYGTGDDREALSRIELLHEWYLALRLLWALDHEYQPGVERGVRELSRFRVEQATNPG